MVMHGETMRDNRQNCNKRNLARVSGEVFPHEDSQAAEQVAPKGCAVPLPGDFQDSSRHILEQPGLASELAWFGQRFGAKTSKVQPELFCNSLKVKGSVNHPKVSS